MAENELTTLPPKEEEVQVPEVPVEEPSAVVPSGEVAAAPPVVDKTPDPASLRAEIEELERKRQKAQEDAVYWRKEKAAARADYFKGDRGERQEPPPTQIPPQIAGLGPEPVLANFEDYEQYSKALVDFNVKKAKIEWEIDQNRRQQEQSARERSETLQAKLQRGYEKYEDFEEVAFDRSATHITPMIVDILADCEAPEDLAYYLAKNRVEGVAISRMTPIQAARAIAKLEVKLAAETSPARPPSPPKTTGAPAPIKPIGAAGAGTGHKDPEKMTQKEYEEWRKSQGARPF